FLTSWPISESQSFSNNIWSIDWNILNPDRLGATRIMVTNTTPGSGISDTSGVFYLSPKIRVDYPNGGELLYAKKPTTVKWYTEGNTYAVDLYYTTDPLRSPSSWTPIADNPLTSLGDKNQSQYLWTLPDVESDSVWVRIQDSNYTSRYDRTFSGPYDDCNNQFEIDYYTVSWFVYYVDSQGETNGLTSLSVSDSSGWSESSLDCTDSSGNDLLIVHEYPYGKYDTAWYREYFSDEVVFQWLCDSHHTQTVAMTASDVEPDYHVMANFTFDSSKTNFSIQSWLERSGSILQDPEWSRIEIYNSGGTNITSLTETNSSSGIFWDDWQVPSDDYDSTEVFLALVQIRYSGQTYSSAMTFQMRQTADDTDITADYDVEAAFVYNTSSTNFGIQVWLQSAGVILGTPDGCRIEISDTASGSNVDTLREASQTNGLFRMTWDVNGLGFDESDVFWGQVYVTNLTEVYSGGFSFQMRQYATDAITNIMDDVENTGAAVSNILDDTTSILSDITNLLNDTSSTTGAVSSIQTNLSDVTSSLNRFESNTGTSLSNLSNALDSVTNALGSVSDDIESSRTNLLDAIDASSSLTTSMLGTVMGDLDSISNIVSVLGPSISNNYDVLTNLSAEVNMDLARILTAPDSVELNDTITVLYKTRRNLSPPPWIVVEGTAYSNNMTEIITGMGIYEADVTASWGTNSYRLVCCDPDMKGADSVMLNVVETFNPGEGDSAAIASMSNSLALMDTNLLTVMTMISDDATESSLNTVQTSVDDVQTAIDNLELLVSDNASAADVAAVQTSIDGVQSSVDGVQDSVDGVQDSIDDVDATVTSIEDTVDDTASDVNSIDSNVNSLDSSISSVESSVNSLDASMSSVESAVSGVESTVGGLESSISAIESTVSSVESSVSTIESSVSGVEASMTSLESAISSVESAVDGIEISDGDAETPATVIESPEAGLDASVEASIGALEATISSAESKIDALSGELSQIGADAAGAMQFAQKAKTEAGNAASGVEELKEALLTGMDSETMEALSRVSESVASMQGNLDSIPGALTGGMNKKLAELLERMNALADQEGVPTMTEVKEGGDATELDDASMLDLTKSIEEMKGKMKHMEKLLDKAAFKPVITETLLGSE
ncbi:hypothetical protein BVX94_02515, partial [bacterium B17]